MRKYLIPIIFIYLFILTHFGVTDMAVLTDIEMKSVTGQAGIVGFEQALEVSRDLDKDMRKKVFDKVFVKNSGSDYSQSSSNQITFKEAFSNRLALNFTKGLEKELKINFEEKNFGRIFSKFDGIDKEIQNVKKNIRINSIIKMGDLKIKFN